MLRDLQKQNTLKFKKTQKNQTTKKCHQMFLSWRVKYQLKTVLCAQQILSFTVCETRQILLIIIIIVKLTLNISKK